MINLEPDRGVGAGLVPAREGTSPSPTSKSARIVPWLLLLLIAAASVAPRLPFFANAATAFNSDEAVNALVVKHMVEGKELTFYSWDATYYGLAEGVMALPFVWVQGYTPLAFKLAAFTGFLLLLVAAFLLGRRLFGAAEGLAAAALLAVFSPLVVLWSTIASGGYLLVIAWGTLTLLWLDAVRGLPPERRSGWRLAMLGFMIGFGLYIYELFLIYVAVLAVVAVIGLAGLTATWRQVPRTLFWMTAGFLVGWAPKILLLAYGSTGSKKPSYGLAKPDKMLANLELLADRCAPALFGANPAGLEDVARWTGRPSWPLATIVGLLVLAFYAAAWLWGFWQAQRQIAGAFRRPPGTETLLVLLVPVAALLFVLSPNPQDVLSNRYLLPWLTSLPILAGALLVRMARRSRGSAAAALVLGLLLAGFPLVQTVDVSRMAGYLEPGLRIADRPETLEWVLRHLRQEGIQGAYAPYWLSYEATFLSGEEIVVAPLQDWDRYPAYTHAVNRLSRVAYVFETTSEQEAAFLARLRKSGKPYEARQIGYHTVYTDPGGGRLLPVSAPLVPLTRPRCRIVASRPPAAAAPGEVLAIPVRITNTGTEAWSAFGTPTGSYRVTFSYHWLDAAGTVVVFDGERTLLPEDMAPGRSVDLTARVVAPQAPPGEYRLVLTLVQEHVDWFDHNEGGKLVLPVRLAAAAERKAA